MESRKAVLECFSLFVHVTSAHGIVLWQDMRSVRGALWRIPNMVTWWSTFPSLALWFHLFLTDWTKFDFEAQSKKYKIQRCLPTCSQGHPWQSYLWQSYTSLPQSPTFSVWPPFWSRHPSLFWTEGHRNRCPNLRPRNEVGTSNVRNWILHFAVKKREKSTSALSFSCNLDPGVFTLFFSYSFIDSYSSHHPSDLFRFELWGSSFTSFSGSFNQAQNSKVLSRYQSTSTSLKAITISSCSCAATNVIRTASHLPPEQKCSSHLWRFKGRLSSGRPNIATWRSSWLFAFSFLRTDIGMIWSRIGSNMVGHGKVLIWDLCADHVWMLSLQRLISLVVLWLAGAIDQGKHCDSW